MKKGFVIISLLSLIVIGLTSCVKLCNCKEYENGELIYENQEPQQSGLSCSDLTIDNTDPETNIKDGIFCE
jgi:hypothetical protein